MKKTLLGVVGALILSCCLPTNGFSATAKTFKDVPPTKHFAEAVNDLAERNMIGGYPDGTFKPGNSITRGQAAAIIAKMTNVDLSTVKNPGYKDVSTENGYYKAIAAMTEKGMISGYGDGRFGPNDPIKRGQMASILVKAFDLPRERIYNHPFKDIRNSDSHAENILNIYGLGITTGTTPTTFSPNASITRGQAAKMLKATEEAKPPMITIKASDLNWQYARIHETDAEKGLFKAFQVYGKEGYYEDEIQLVPLKEGTGIISLEGTPSKDSNAYAYKKYYVHIAKNDGELKITLEETEDMAPTPVTLFDINEKVRSITLSTMEGEKLSDNVPFIIDEYQFILFDIRKPGQYIATVKLESGEEIRHGIEAKQNDSQFYYDVEVIRESPSVLYEEDAKYDIGDYVLEGNADGIVKISRQPGTNKFFFEATGDGEGSVIVNYGKELLQRDCDETEYCDTNIWYGLQATVRIIGPIVNVYVYQVFPN
ncbi:S-layer homology domain-containing protein [Sporosarcina sp. Sa2YVA2]|uniref:S-layer homology domain-containing protein n=1 Tax=Sporosarcina quadrami TaxID=2762234 RepID=A0ABR8UDZ3_9BACL|nr:S-layer homology domain-containing protein [Sporosarcina quadrami]MBD7986257.1 S-layer homology domain-containing protein [Sporosarcina quadrami]